MARITYSQPKHIIVSDVYLDAKHVGRIHTNSRGYYAYVPNGISTTNTEINWFGTLYACRIDIESE